MGLGRIALALLIVLFVLSAVHAAKHGPVVVANSKDWQDKYLAAIHSVHIGADVIYFNNLGDAQIKTQTIAANRTVLVYESARPVVKNYESVLRTNGFSNFEITLYEDYRELQGELFDDAETLVILDPRFGNEAIAAAPLLSDPGARPFFLDEETRDQLDPLARRADDVILAGRFPIRLVEGIEADVAYQDLPNRNADALTREAAERLEEDWGVIMRIDRVDFVSMRQGLPIIVYSGSLTETVETVRATGIERFEVISADAANLATQIEDGVGKDLSLILKYGRTITNLPGMTGKILDLDTVFVDYPSPDLIIEDISYYESADALLLTYRNRGNADTYFLVNVEYGDNALSDSHLRVVPPGESVQIPYPLDVSTAATEAFINARYDLGLPLSRSVLSEDGTQLIRRSVDRTDSANSTVALGDARYDDTKGVLAVSVTGDGVARVEVPIDETLSFTSGPTETIDGEHTFLIRTPYHDAATFDEPISIVLYHGADAPVYEQSFEVTPVVTHNRFTGSVTAVAGGALAILLVALILGLVLYVRAHR